MKWEKTTFGELKAGDVFAQKAGLESGTGYAFEFVFIRSDGMLRLNNWNSFDPVYRLVSHEFPKYVVELLAEVDAFTAENATLKAQVEHYKLQSDQLCDRVEVLAAENATLRSKLAALVTAGEDVIKQWGDDSRGEVTQANIDALASAVKSAKEGME